MDNASYPPEGPGTPGARTLGTRTILVCFKRPSPATTRILNSRVKARHTRDLSVDVISPYYSQFRHLIIITTVTITYSTHSVSPSRALQALY
jgi:hypothetical protein